MDIKAYIESGIIENYVLGATTKEENQEIEKLADQYPEIRVEIEASQFALTEYIMQYEQTPPPSLRDKVMDKLAILEKEEDTEEILTGHTQNPAQLSKPSKVFSMLPYVAAAAAVLFVISLGLNVLLYNYWQGAEKQLTIARNQNQEFAQDLNVQQAKYQQLTSNLAIIQDPRLKQVDLNSAIDNYPDASVALYWNDQSQELYLQIKNLPKPPPGKQYQLWAIKDGKAKDAGLLSVRPEENIFTLQKMNNIQEAQVFAITLEQEGGVESAQGDIYVMGEVS